MLLVQNKKNSFSYCPVYGLSNLRRSKYFSLCILFLVSCFVFLSSLQNSHAITIPTQVPKAQSLHFRFIEIPEVQEIQKKEPETKKMLAENSDYKVFEPVKPEKIKPKKVVPQKPKRVKTPPPKIVKQKKITPAKQIKENKETEQISTTSVESSSLVETQVQIAAEKERYAKQHALSVLFHILEKHKRYPKAARRSRTEGTVSLLITINTQGIIISTSIENNNAPSVLVRATRQLGEKIIGLNTQTNNAKNFQVIVPVAYHMSD